MPIRRWLVVACALLVALVHMPVFAQTATDIDLPAQPLGQALNALAKATGTPIAAPADLVAGRQAPALRGRFSAQDALARLLSGSGLEARREGTGFVIQRAGLVQGERPEQQLPEVKVQASAEARPGDLPKPYAGGQVARGGRVGILGNRDMMDTPFNQSSYTAELIQNQQVQRISEVLANDPTVQAVNSASTGIDEFSIRGFNVSNTDVLFNGLAGVAPSFANAMMAESVERVEVLKGPNAFLNGAAQSGAIGGTINVVPKRATNNPLTQFTLGYASDAQFGGHIDVGRRFGQQHEFGVRFNGVHRDGDAAIDNQSRRSSLAALGLDYQGGRLRLSADLGYQDQHLQGVRTGLLVFAPAVPTAPRNRTNYGDPADFSDSEVYYGTVRGEYDIGERLTLFAAAGGNERSQRWWMPRFSARFIINERGDLAPGSRELLADRMEAHTLEAGLVGGFDTGPIRHQMTLAHTRLDRNWRRGVGAALLPIGASNIYTPTYSSEADTRVPDLGPVLNLNDLQLSSTALADTLSFLDDRAILILGARLQRIDATNYDRPTGAITSAYDEDKVTPMAGLVFKLTEGVSLYANYIEGLQQGAQAPPNAANAGQIFPPYVTRQYEVGGKVDFGQFATTLGIYQVAQPSAFIDPATSIFGIDGEQRHRGVDFNMFGEIARGVRLLGGVAYIDSRLTKTLGGLNDGNRGIGTPEWNAVLGAEWDVPFAAGLTLTGRVNYNGPQFLDVENKQRLPHWSRLDIGARYRIEYAAGKAVTLRANLNNVLDKDYWQTVSGALEGMGEPRTFRLSASFDF